MLMFGRMDKLSYFSNIMLKTNANEFSLNQSKDFILSQKYLIFLTVEFDKLENLIGHKNV